jgi:CheY-like chemotaxis protein
MKESLTNSQSMSKRILIGEDSSSIQILTKRVLEFQNYQIFSAKNGEEILQKFEKEDFDVILMDIGMPVMDGIKCLEKIRAMKNTKKAMIPVIAITGNPNNLRLDEFKKLGFTDFISKPINFDLLVDAIKKYTS